MPHSRSQIGGLQSKIGIAQSEQVHRGTAAELGSIFGSLAVPSIDAGGGHSAILEDLDKGIEYFLEVVGSW